MEAAALGGMLCVLLIALPIGLLVGAVILRAAVSWYNRMSGATGGAAPPAAYAGYSSNVATATDSNNPFASPTTYGATAAPVNVGVPEPGIGRAMGIVFVSALAGLPVSIVVEVILAAAPEARLPLTVLSIPLNFLIGAAILKAMLPTDRFGTACLISLLQFVISLLVGLAIVVVVVLVMLAFGGLASLGR
jgi:hypothetical protein